MSRQHSARTAVWSASSRGTLAAQAGGVAIAPADDFNYVTATRTQRSNRKQDETR